MPCLSLSILTNLCSPIQSYLKDGHLFLFQNKPTREKIYLIKEYFFKSHSSDEGFHSLDQDTELSILFWGDTENQGMHSHLWSSLSSS
jgi:hypothetical protein